MSWHVILQQLIVLDPEENPDFAEEDAKVCGYTRYWCEKTGDWIPAHPAYLCAHCKHHYFFEEETHLCSYPKPLLGDFLKRRELEELNIPQE